MEVDLKNKRKIKATMKCGSHSQVLKEALC